MNTMEIPHRYAIKLENVLKLRVFHFLPGFLETFTIPLGVSVYLLIIPAATHRLAVGVHVHIRLPCHG